jgi:hypothetical protein
MINQLIDQVRQSTDYQINKRILREKILGDLHFTHQGGLFLASAELISFLHCWDSNDLVLEDTYGNPIKCNRQQILAQSKECYQLAMNEWHIQHEKLKTSRKI